MVIGDLGSGINYKKKGLTKLLGMILRKEVSTLVLTHRDRLLRFGSQLLFNICEFCEVEVIVLDDHVEADFDFLTNKQLACDLVEITRFLRRTAPRVYGKRAQDNRKRRTVANAA